MRKMIDFECTVCGAVTEDRYIDPDALPLCECGGGQRRVLLTSRQHSRQSGVIQDSIEGGIEIRHGVCWPDGTPRRFYSKTDIRKAAKEAGWTWGGDHTEHVPNPNSGSDKSAHTSRWV